MARTTKSAADKLSDYRKKRDFNKTTEPAGATDGDEKNGNHGLRYVMHKHAASHDHFDLRLQQDGVLRSWALPKGPSLEAGEKRLAVEVEDHPLEYGDFEGTIPEDQYGGGTVMLWDTGAWRCNGKQTEDHLDIELNAKKLKGAWTLVRTKGLGRSKSSAGRKSAGKKSRDWLMIKRSDHHKPLKPHDRSVVSNRTMQQITRDRDKVWQQGRAQEQQQAMPVETLEAIDLAKLPRSRKQSIDQPWRPQLATAVDQPPDQENWLHEIKFDGYRLLVVIDKSEVQLLTRNGKDWCDRFPPLVKALRQLAVSNAVLDGEVVALSSEGTSDFRKLQHALSSKRGLQHLVFHVFDLLYLDGYDLRQTPLEQRKDILRRLLRASDRTDQQKIRFADHVKGQGEAVHQQACQLGLEGVISKKADSAYQTGRQKTWQKSKCTVHEEFVVGGYCAPSGGRNGFASLLMGGYQNGKFIYSGRVGTGFDQGQIKHLHRQLQTLKTGTKPFHSEVPAFPGIHWVKPKIVIEVEFTERTGKGYLRHPVFRGVREDKDAGDIVIDSEVKVATIDATDPAVGVKETTHIEGVRLTHPDRVLYQQQGITKSDLALFYQSIEAWLLPWLMQRPLSLLRCPEGNDSTCFFQKHPRSNLLAGVPQMDIADKQGKKQPYCYIENISHVIALVQAGVLEIHPWGCHIDALEKPDIMIFDLDPADDVPWKRVIHCARTLRDRLQQLELESFVKITGGKGIHVVVPLRPQCEWDLVKAFASAVAEAHARDDPSHLTTNMNKRKRQGKIFIDYLRNGRGNTAIANYSTRARANAPVAVPLRWDELSPAVQPNHYRVDNLHRRLRALKQDPWHDFEQARRPLSKKIRQQLGVN